MIVEKTITFAVDASVAMFQNFYLLVPQYHLSCGAFQKQFYSQTLGEGLILTVSIVVKFPRKNFGAIFSLTVTFQFSSLKRGIS